MPIRLPQLRSLAIAGAAAALAACSVQRLAVHSIGNALAADGSVFESDPDPELIGDALPFALKLMESLLAADSDQRGLLLAAARGFVLYGYAYVESPDDEPGIGLARVRAERLRARDLYLRAHGYALRALELDYPGIGARLRDGPERAAAAIGRDPSRDVPALYWTAVSLALAISSARNEPRLLARLPEVEALVSRALALDEAWDEGALHELAIQLATAGTGAADDGALRKHYERALELSQGHRASLFVTYAQAVALRHQDKAAFVELMRRALAVDADAVPDERLLNVIAQRQAQRMLDRVDELFL